MADFGAAITDGYNGPAQPAPDMRIIKMDVFEDTSPTLLRRVVDVGGYINSDNVIDVVLRVFDMSGDTPTVPTFTLPIGVEECIVRGPAPDYGLIVDSAWDFDALGYNFRHKVWQQLLPLGGRIYRCEYTIHVQSLDVTIPTREIPLIWELHTLSRSGS